MGTKRSFTELDSASEDGDAPPPEIATDGGKKRRPNGKIKHKPKEGSTEWAKKRARTIKRTLQRNPDLPANVRSDLERELAAHDTTIEDKTFHRRRSTMISKYHMVRFFERKKATRLVTQLRREIDQGDNPDEAQSLKQQLHIAEVDEAYTIYFPYTEPYISLYAGSKPGATDEDNDKMPLAKAALESERPAMWTVVEKAMKDGPGPLKRLRERRSPDQQLGTRKPTSRKPRQSTTPKSIPTNNKQSKMNNRVVEATESGDGQLNRRERRRLMRESKALPVTKDEDSDGGGFFEKE